MKYSYAQILPEDRSVDWTKAGFTRDLPNSDYVLDITDFGGVGDGVTSNSIAMTNAIDEMDGLFGVVYFPSGEYFFDETIILPSNIIVRGNGAEHTSLIFDLEGEGNLFRCVGDLYEDFIPINAASKEDEIITLQEEADSIFVGTYLKISQNDFDLVTSEWALGMVGQIVKIDAIYQNQLTLSSPLRKEYTLEEEPKISRIDPVQNIGLECFKIKRLDQTDSQRSNILFRHAVNCWVKGIESDHCNYAHVRITTSTNIQVEGCYFYDAFDYGGGGKAYGVMLENTTGECRIENNIFKHLRHAMILQAGANGNVFAYNYSLDPYWDDPITPADFSGDMVLHGNYVYANLFEGNIGQNIMVDVSHGKNGPNNTFFRNRAEHLGILNDVNTNQQNYIGNEVTGEGLFLGNYFINGEDHFEYANAVIDNIVPFEIDNLEDESYYCLEGELGYIFDWTIDTWPAIGFPNDSNIGSIPARNRYLSEEAKTKCDVEYSEPIIISTAEKDIEESLIYPNPVMDYCYLKNIGTATNVEVYSTNGILLQKIELTKEQNKIDFTNYTSGLYFLILKNKTQYINIEKIVKQ